MRNGLYLAALMVSFWLGVFVFLVVMLAVFELASGTEQALR